MTRPAEGSTLKRLCKECGAGLTVLGPKGKLPKFCSEAHRTAFNMRRRQRGAELYDFFMALRFERSAATEEGVRRALDRLASRFRDEDHRERCGRTSWGDWRERLRDDMTLTMEWGGDRAPWSPGREVRQPR